MARERAARQSTAGIGRFRRACVDWIEAHALDEGRSDAPYAGLSVFRISSPTTVLKEPTFGVVKEVRLEAARTLLLSEGARASDVALRVGYESAAHFTRDFKRRFGASPVRYIRKLRDDETRLD